MACDVASKNVPAQREVSGDQSNFPISSALVAHIFVVCIAVPFRGLEKMASPRCPLSGENRPFSHRNGDQFTLNLSV